MIVLTKPQEIDVMKPTEEEFSKELYDELGAFIDSLETTKGALIEILHRAQEIFGYLPRDVQLYVARKLGIPGAEVYLLYRIKSVLPVLCAIGFIQIRNFFFASSESFSKSYQEFSFKLLTSSK